MIRLVSAAPWTVATGLLVAIASLGLVAPDPGILEFDREALHRGELWRLLTGSFVHWSGGHLVLDLGAFLAVGLLFERSLGRRYPAVLAGALAAVGVLLLLDPRIERYRGLSGVAAGQYAAALAAEIVRGRDEWRRRRRGSPGLHVPPGLALPAAAALLFALKVATEWGSGTLLLGTERLGDLGEPLPSAHLAGVIGALGGAIAFRGAPAPAGTERFRGRVGSDDPRGELGECVVAADGTSPPAFSPRSSS